ncbi:TPA: hypothetical protein ACH3X1_015286 [Trebouxia sp. C0004]
MVQDNLLQIKQFSVLNEYVTSLPSYFGVRIPSYSLDNKKIANATERADIFKLLPVAVLAFPSVKAIFLQAIQALLEFHTLRDLEHHTEQQLKQLDEARKRTQRETLKLKHMQASEFAMPKFFLERFWVHTIEMLGCANLSSTGYGESSHKELKAAFRFTNKHNSHAINAQTLKQVSRKRTATVMAQDAKTRESSISRLSAALEQSMLAELVAPTARTAIFAWYNFVGYLATALGSAEAGKLVDFLQLKQHWTAVESCRAVFFQYSVIGGAMIVILVVAGFKQWLSLPHIAVAISDEALLQPLNTGAESPSEQSSTSGSYHQTLPSEAREECHQKWGMSSKFNRVMIHLSLLFALDSFAGGLLTAFC